MHPAIVILATYTNPDPPFVSLVINSVVADDTVVNLAGDHQNERQCGFFAQNLLQFCILEESVGDIESVTEEASRVHTEFTRVNYRTHSYFQLRVGDRSVVF